MNFGPRSEYPVTELQITIKKKTSIWCKKCILFLRHCELCKLQHTTSVTTKTADTANYRHSKMLVYAKCQSVQYTVL